MPDGPSAHSHAGKEVPNARSMVSAFGPDSPAFHQAYPELLALFRHVKDVPEVSLQFRLWRGYQLGVDRSPEDDEALFIRETYVALLARLVARMFLDVSPITKDVTELTKILEGEFFQAQNITNFIEDDFFTWLLCPPVVDQGAALMAALAESLSHYDFVSGIPDLLTGLYEEFAPRSPETDAGGNPVPGWLAESAMSNDIGSLPGPDQSVLHPHCGSGQFLVAAVGAIKQARLERGDDAFDTLLLILDRLQGMDSRPLAVTIARTGYLLALGDLVQNFHPPVLLPVYLSGVTTPPVRDPEQGRGDSEPVYEFGSGEPGEVFHIPESVALDPVMLDWLFGRLPNYLRGALLRTRGQDTEDAIQAVLAAFHNYLAAPKPRTPIPDPLSRFAAEVMLKTAESLIRIYLNQPTNVWLHILKNAPAPVHMAQRKFDLVLDRFSTDS